MSYWQQASCAHSHRNRVCEFWGQKAAAGLWSAWLGIHETAVQVSGLAAVSLSGERLPYRQVFMKVRHCATISEVCRCVSVPSEDPFGGEESLQAHRTAGVNPSCADTDFCPFKWEIGLNLIKTTKKMSKFLENLLV